MPELSVYEVLNRKRRGEALPSAEIEEVIKRYTAGNIPDYQISALLMAIAINGMITDIAAWLAGRTPTLGSLRASADADGVDLPELLPWPSSVPSAK